MLEIIVKYNIDKDKQYELKLPFQLTRGQAREVKGRQIQEIVIHEQVFKPKCLPASDKKK